MPEITLLQNVMGWTGSLLIIFAYLFLTLDFFQAEDFGYNAMNLLGALLLGYRVYLDRNWANLSLEFFFAAVALFALYHIVF